MRAKLTGQKTHGTSDRAKRSIFDAIRLLLDTRCHFSTNDIATTSTYSQPTVIRAIKQLEADSIISVERANGMCSRYTILVPDK
jgi:CRP-like cAMP-binding protein